MSSTYRPAFGGLSSELSFPPVTRRLAVLHRSPGLRASSPRCPPVPRGCRRMRPINPVADSRTAARLRAVPDPSARPVEPRAGARLRQRHRVRARRRTRDYVLDAEILRLRLGVARDLSPAAFVDGGRRASAAAMPDSSTAFSTGTTVSSASRSSDRERRPHNEFLYRARRCPTASSSHAATERPLPGRRPARGRAPAGPAPADRRHASPCRLPPAPAGYGRGVVAGGLVTTVRAPLASPLVDEGSLGVGYTPTHGDLTAVPAHELRCRGARASVALLGTSVALRQPLLPHAVLSRHDDSAARPPGPVARFRLDPGDAKRAGVADRHDRGPGAERPGGGSGVPAGGGALSGQVPT